MGNLDKKDERYIKPRNIIISILYEFMPLLSKLKSIYVEKSFKFISNHILPTSFRSESKSKLTLSDIRYMAMYENAYDRAISNRNNYAHVYLKTTLTHALFNLWLS